MNMVDQIMAHEDGTLGPTETLGLFALLIQSGQAWQLQGCYGRAAHSLITQGFITPAGEITMSGLRMAQELEDA